MAPTFNPRYSTVNSQNRHIEKRTLSSSHFLGADRKQTSLYAHGTCTSIYTGRMQRYHLDQQWPLSSEPIHCCLIVVLHSSLLAECADLRRLPFRIVKGQLRHEDPSVYPRRLPLPNGGHNVCPNVARSASRARGPMQSLLPRRLSLSAIRRTAHH